MQASCYVLAGHTPNFHNKMPLISGFDWRAEFPGILAFKAIGADVDSCWV